MSLTEQKENFVFKHFELNNKDIHQRYGDFGLKFLFTKTSSLKLVNQDFQNEVTLPAGCSLTSFEAIETMFPMPTFTTVTSPMKLKSARIRLTTASINVRLFDLSEVEKLDLQLSSYTSAICQTTDELDDLKELKLYFDSNERMRTWKPDFAKLKNTLEILKVQVEGGDSSAGLDEKNMPSLSRILSKEFTKQSLHTEVDLDHIVIDVALNGLQKLS